MRSEIIDTFCGAGGTTEGFEQAEYAGYTQQTIIGKNIKRGTK